MSSREEFIRFYKAGNEKFSSLCKRFGISRKTGYVLLSRYQQEGIKGLEDRTRKPLESPFKTPARLEEKILNLRIKKYCWGGRKIRAWLLNHGETCVPSASTITDILRRAGLIEKSTAIPGATGRFEHEAPNDLWQCDFKGHFPLRMGRCHPLTILDDHSRFSICLKACENEKKITVQQHLINIFQEYGLPWRMNFDNGPPWGAAGKTGITSLCVWLIMKGIRVSYSRPYHPQTNGKDERFHRTLKAELLRYNNYNNLEAAQKSFDIWRMEYNFERPHEALLMQPPSIRYLVSNRLYSEQVAPIEYRDTDIIRKVDVNGHFKFKNKKYFAGEGLRGLPVGLREVKNDKIEVYFLNQKLFGFTLTNE